MENKDVLNSSQKMKKKPPEEEKRQLRKQFLELREMRHSVSSPENWGPRQFYRTLELLKIKSLDVLSNKILVACYFPIRHELDFTSLAQPNWIFPKMKPNRELVWFEYGDGVTNYSVNSIGIKEKDDEYCFKYSKDKLPLLCFVPGIVASKEGHRLGYGGGYYDKFLSEFREQITSVLCLPTKDFILNHLPTEEQDEVVDLIVF